MFGDSITWIGCHEFDQKVPATVTADQTVCLGWPGATSKEMLRLIADPSYRSDWPKATLPWITTSLPGAINSADVLVVGLGTNDVLREQVNTTTTAVDPDGFVTAADFATEIDDMMRLAQGKKVYWYTIGVATDNPGINASVLTRNQQLRLAQQRWPNLELLGWNAVVAAHPDYLMDGVHPNDAGTQARWELLQEALQQS